MLLRDRIIRALFGLPVQRPRPDYEARLARTRTLYLVRPVPPAFDWEREVPELVPPPRRVVERVVVDGRAFYVARTVES